jgi:hypothetical protein
LKGMLRHSHILRNITILLEKKEKYHLQRNFTKKSRFRSYFDQRAEIGDPPCAAGRSNIMKYVQNFYEDNSPCFLGSIKILCYQSKGAQSIYFLISNLPQPKAVTTRAE